RSLERRGEVPQGRGGQRPRGHGSRPRARPGGQPLVRREPRAPRARQARHGERENLDLPDACRDGAAWRRGDRRRRRQGHGVGLHPERRRALRPGHREVHRVPLAPRREERRGSGATYGAAGDRDGNGWWSQMAMDTVYKGDIASGKAVEIKLPDVKAVDRMFGEDRAFYETV